jgi:hypothetical protein
MIPGIDVGWTWTDDANAIVTPTDSPERGGGTSRRRRFIGSASIVALLLSHLTHLTHLS